MTQMAPVFADGLDDICQEFLVESYENLDDLDRALVVLEQDPTSRPLLASIFRTIHTIKGTSGFLAFGQLEAVTHVGENVLSRLRDGKLSLTPEITTTLLRLVDTVRELLATIELNGVEGDVDTAEVIALLDAILEPPADAVVVEEVIEPVSTPETVETVVIDEAVDSVVLRVPDVDLHMTPEEAPQPEVAVTPSAPVLDGPLHREPNGFADGSFHDEHDEDSPARRSVADSTIRVDVGLLDQLMRMVGELVLTRNQVVQHVGDTKTVAEGRRAIDRAAIVADLAGALEAAVVAKRNEFLSFIPMEDGVEVRGFLSWGTAGVVLPCFDQANDALYRNGTLAEDDSDDAELKGVMGRTPSLRRKRREHRNAQIFAEPATRLLDDGDLGTKHAQRPHLTVTVHADDVAAGLGGDLLLPGYGSVPVPNESIERFLCDAEIHPVLTRRPRPAPGFPSVSPPPPRTTADPRAGSSDTSEPHYPGSIPASTDPPWRPPMRPRVGGGWEFDIPGEREPSLEELEADSDLAAMTEFEADLDDHASSWNRFLGEQPRHVLDVGRSRRTAPPKIRRALTIRDGGCAAPGCDTDPTRCEAHRIAIGRKAARPAHGRWAHSTNGSVTASPIRGFVLACRRGATCAGRTRSPKPLR